MSSQEDIKKQLEIFRDKISNGSDSEKETFEWLKEAFPEEESLGCFLKYVNSSSTGISQDKIFPIWSAPRR